jgi:signal transduction histidine kinase
MKTPLRILHLEDEPLDADLIQANLEDNGICCTITRVKSEDAFVTAMEKGGVDLILSDCSLPDFSGLSAAEMVRTRWPDVPFILVSGTLGEERAIDSFKRGATDYVLKERLSRLVPAVRRAMQEVNDCGERQRLQAQFIEAQKMEVVGHLAGGVAHDFNNILAVIMGYSDLITSEASPEKIRKYTEQIRDAAERAAGLTRQLLVFSRKQTVQPVVLDLNVVVHDLDQMLRRLIDENIEMTFLPGAQLGHIKADPGYIGQILMNLAVNARDAMPLGGQLTILTNNEPLDVECALLNPKAGRDHYVMLSVTDTGTGMTEDVKSRLFEAFFTTKPKGKGTGLGLATCQTIVQQAGGYICVKSEIGRGTTFKVYFPRVADCLTVSARPSLSKPLPHGTETLLVVEDDPAVRHLARGVLEAQGYTVLSSSNGQDALHVAGKHLNPPIRLVITDVVMPLMGGKVMAEWLKTSFPDIKILFTSGYSDESITGAGVLESGVEFLPKPYTPWTLAVKVREMLDSQ